VPAVPRAPSTPPTCSSRPWPAARPSASGATTLDEHRKYIEKDGALERRFQQIIVNPPSKDETVEVLRGLRDRVEIRDEALQAAVELSDRYISGRCLPDKAIDVIDEAGARVRLNACRLFSPIL
jgi:ATP-dependent Clp protease ATP-binding subunit ClpC